MDSSQKFKCQIVRGQCQLCVCCWSMCWVCLYWWLLCRRCMVCVTTLWMYYL